MAGSMRVWVASAYKSKSISSFSSSSLSCPCRRGFFSSYFSSSMRLSTRSPSSSYSCSYYSFPSTPSSFLSRLIGFTTKTSTPVTSLRFLHATPFQEFMHNDDLQQPHRHCTVCCSTHGLADQTEQGEETSSEWEEEEGTEPEEGQLGDGGCGGGVVLQNVPWGERVLSIALEVLQPFGGSIELFSFKTTPNGYIYMRLDKLSHIYGCPSMKEIESYNNQYKKRLDEAGAQGDIPDDLAIQVSSPGADRLLKVPHDLDRFKDMPMRVCYTEEGVQSTQMENGVFLLDSIDLEAENCVWKLANVKENRDPLSKGRPLSREKRDWRLTLPYAMCKKVTLYVA